MKVDKATVDYSFYLVTDNNLIPEGLDIYQQVEKALQNGATLIQLREKDLDTGDFIKRAEQIHQLTQKYNVPLIINDRVDVAIAIGAEGVHIGQSDMSPSLVRKMIGDDKILGLSTRNAQELLAVFESDVLIDYVGIGAVYATTTKDVKIPPLGIDGVKSLLQLIKENKPSLKSVLIGGLNKHNIASTLSDCHYDGFNTNGVAVVSCIMAQYDAALEARETLNSINIGFGRFQPTKLPGKTEKAVIHFITNSVATNLSANVCIAVGGSPIMSEHPGEFSDFTAFPNVGLVLNTGTPDEDKIQMYKDAVKIYNFNMRPIVYDPVGCGASTVRRKLMNELLSLAHFRVIKGNLAELAAVAGVDNSSMIGVDSTMKLDVDKAVKCFRKLAIKTRAIIVMTGEIDIIVDGITPDKVPKVATIHGGHPLMADITASGCALGGVIARYISAVSYFHSFEATIKAVALYKEAGFKAAQNSRGPGSFMVNFLDELYDVSKLTEFKNTKITLL